MPLELLGEWIRSVRCKYGFYCHSFHVFQIGEIPQKTMMRSNCYKMATGQLCQSKIASTVVVRVNALLFI